MWKPENQNDRWVKITCLWFGCLCFSVVQLKRRIPEGWGRRAPATQRVALGLTQTVRVPSRSRHSVQGAARWRLRYISYGITAGFCVSFLTWVYFSSVTVWQQNIWIGSWGTGSHPASRTPTLKVTATHAALTAHGHLRASQRWWSPAGSRNLSKNSARAPESATPTAKDIRIIINSLITHQPLHPAVVWPAVATNIHAPRTPQLQQRQGAFNHLPVSSVRKL